MKNLVSLASGSAPLAPDTMKFLKAALNVDFGQGYGLTESFAGICAFMCYEAQPGSCGPISVTCEANLRDLPEMNYLASDLRGQRVSLCSEDHRSSASTSKIHWRLPKSKTKMDGLTLEMLPASTPRTSVSTLLTGSRTSSNCHKASTSLRRRLKTLTCRDFLNWRKFLSTVIRSSHA